ncbi:GMC family oxidoreductase N-terminal domain-containing protein [Amycolatopsis sp. NPDC004368]
MTAARTTTEVVLTAGAIGTPHLLLLSGTGAEAQLREHGLAVVAALPGVGQNHHDHVMSGVRDDAGPRGYLAHTGRLPRITRMDRTEGIVNRSTARHGGGGPGFRQ